MSQTRGGRNGGGRGPRPAVTLRARLSALYPGTSGRRLKQWLEGGRVQVNGKVVRRGDASVGRDGSRRAGPLRRRRPSRRRCSSSTRTPSPGDRQAARPADDRDRERARADRLPPAARLAGGARRRPHLRRPPPRSRDLRPASCSRGPRRPRKRCRRSSGRAARARLRGARRGQGPRRRGHADRRGCTRTAGSACGPRAAARRRARRSRATGCWRAYRRRDAAGAHADDGAPRPDPRAARRARPPDRGRPRLRQPPRSAPSRVPARHPAGLRAPRAGRWVVVRQPDRRRLPARVRAQAARTALLQVAGRGSRASFPRRRRPAWGGSARRCTKFRNAWPAPSYMWNSCGLPCRVISASIFFTSSGEGLVSSTPKKPITGQAIWPVRSKGVGLVAPRLHDVAAVEHAGGAPRGRPRAGQHEGDATAHAEAQHGEIADPRPRAAAAGGRWRRRRRRRSPGRAAVRSRVIMSPPSWADGDRGRARRRRSRGGRDPPPGPR